MTQAGPVDLPGDVAALVALDEVVVHGWDLARATDQPYEPGEAAALACLGFVQSFEPPAEGAVTVGYTARPSPYPTTLPRSTVSSAPPAATRAGHRPFPEPSVCLRPSPATASGTRLVSSGDFSGSEPLR